MLSKMQDRFNSHNLLRAFRSAEDGMVIVWVAVLLPVIFGFAALAVDTAYLYAAKSRAQAAADAAALSSVYIVETASADEVRARGAAAAQDNIPNASNIHIGTLTIERGNWNSSAVYPASGFTSVGDGTAATAVRAYVSLADDEVALSGQTGINLFFARAIGFGEQDVAGEAVANLFGGGPPENCILSTDPNDDDAFEANGDVDMNFYDCNVKVNSDGSAGPGNNPAKIGADLSNSDLSFISDETALYGFESVGDVRIGPQGGLYGYSGDETSGEELQPRITEQVTADPFRSFNPLGQTTGSDFACTSGVDYSSQSTWAGETLNPGVYCGGLYLTGGNDTVDFTPGLYVIQNGDFDVSGGLNLNCSTCIGGAGVTFVLHNPNALGDSYRFNLSGTGTYNLTAPDQNNLPTTSGVPAVTFDQGGFLFWDEPDRTGCDERSEIEAGGCDNGEHTFAGDGGMEFQGAIYAPYSDVVVNGNINTEAGGAGCFIMIGNTYTFNGGGGSEMNFSAEGCEGGFAGTPLITDDIFALVE